MNGRRRSKARERQLAGLGACRIQEIGESYLRMAIEIAFLAEKAYQLEVDRQIEQVRDVGDEPPPEPPTGVELTALDGHRAELLREAYELAREGYEDMPLPEAIGTPLV